MLLLDWGVVALTLVSAGASALAAAISFHQQETGAVAEAALACAAAIGAAWLGRAASRSAKQWQEELVAGHGNDIVLLLDDAGRVIDANDRALEAYGRSLEAIFRHHVREFRHGGSGEELDAQLAALRVKGSGLFETVQRRGDGTPFPAEVSARVLSVRGTRFLHLIVRDVTEMHRARARLVAAERLAAVGSVAAGMAHDINNPLCSVLGNLSYATETLQDGTADLAEVRQALGEAQESAKRVRDLVRDLNAFANGFGEGDGAADLRTVISEAVSASRDVVEPRANVVVDVPALPRVPGPARRLSQVFASILRRAVDGMTEGQPARREIRIVARREDRGHLAIEVADDGPQMAQAEVLHLFEPFFPQGRGERSGGAGLAVVLGMVRAAGGDVVAESTKGRGNVIRVRLPVVASEADASDQNSAA